MSQLREYVVKFPAGVGVGAPHSLSVKGNFFYVKKIVSKGAFDSIRTPNFDGSVRFEFDDAGRISSRPKEGGKRDYERVTLTLLNYYGDPLFHNNDIYVTVVLGSGELYSERTEPPTPKEMVTGEITIPGGAGFAGINPAELLDNSLASVIEMRLNIKSTEADGAYYTADLTDPAPVWLEKGVTEFLQFDSELTFTTPGGTDVVLNYAIIYRLD